MSWLRLIGLPCLLLMMMVGNLNAQDVLRYAGATTLQRYFMPEAARLFNEETGVRFNIEGGNTNPGINALLKGHIDIAGAGRHLTATEKEQGLVEHFIGWDVLTILVHQSNPIDNLSQQQLQDIFMGRVTNWKEVGGSDQPIIVINAPEGSGMRQAVSKLVLKKEPFLHQEIVSAIVAECDQQISLFPMGITALSDSMVDNQDVKRVKVDGIAPTPENLANSSYPYAKPLALVTLGDPEGDLARFVTLATDARGQSILKKHFVPRFP